MATLNEALGSALFWNITESWKFAGRNSVGREQSNKKTESIPVTPEIEKWAS